VADAVGWIATAVFVSSYFCARAERLRRVQMAAAALWIAYGILTHALPVVASNGLVIAVAAWTLPRRAKPRPSTMLEAR
jgi:hypothetical protein